MKLETRNDKTTRLDGLPYDVIKIEKGVYQFRATAGAKPVVLATTATEQEAVLMLVAQAPEDEKQATVNQIIRLLASDYVGQDYKVLLTQKLAKVLA